MNNHGKYDTEQYKIAQATWRDERYGILTEHTRTCQHPECDNEFVVVGRENAKSFKQLRKFCSPSCGASMGGRAKVANMSDSEISYRTLCFRYHEKRCLVCGEANIVAAHHVDYNHDNHTPVNIVPLCPTHHEYVHSPYRFLVESKIEEYLDIWKKENGYV